MKQIIYSYINNLIKGLSYMKKSAKTKEILTEWRNFENRSLIEGQGAITRVRPNPSQRALDLNLFNIANMFIFI